MNCDQSLVLKEFLNQINLLYICNISRVITHELIRIGTVVEINLLYICIILELL
jgi:hypothetical protein